MTLPTHVRFAKRHATELVLLGIIAAALVLRLGNIRESLWVDELHTAWCALGGLDEVAPRAALGNQSPVFFWAQWLWIRLLGPTELVLRLPSVIAGTLLSAAVFLFARRWASAGVGLLAAVMMAVDPTAIFYATEARPYAILQLLTVGHFALLLAMLQRPTARRRAAWIVLAVLLFHLHYTAALVLAAEVLFLIGAAATKSDAQSYRWQQAIFDIAIVGLLCLPALGLVRDIFQRRDNWDFVKKTSPLAVLEWWPACIGGAYVVAAAITRRSRPRHSLMVALLLVWFLVPTSFTWLSTQLDIARLFFPRYLIAVQPAAILLGAYCVTLAPWRWSAWLISGLLIGTSILNGGILEQMAISRLVIPARGEDWRGAIAWLNQERQSRPLPVIVASGLIEMKILTDKRDPALEDYCLYPVTSLYPLEADRNEVAPLMVDRQGRIAQLIEMLAIHRGGAWLVVRGDKSTARQISRGLAAQLSQAESGSWQSHFAASFPGIQLLLIEPERPSLDSLDLRP